ncbi:MAG: hypothetical protein ACI906_004320, partial [Candidatus Latescibacterota bacterium]
LIDQVALSRNPAVDIALEFARPCYTLLFCIGH